MTADLELVRRLIAADHGLAVVATTRPDGTVHASLVNAGLLNDPVTNSATVGLVAGGGARKLAFMRASGRATVVFRSGWEWVAVEGAVGIAGPHDALRGFEPNRLPQLLRDIFQAAGGSHDNWPEFDRVMAAEGRAAVLVQADRITGNG